MKLSKAGLWTLVVLLLCMQAAQVLMVVHRESLTFDEGDHMFAGYMMWKTGDYGLNPEHPPLVKLLAALPVLGEKLWVPELKNRDFKQEAYLDGRDWLARNDGGSQRMVFKMRVAAGLLSLGLSLMVFVAARRFFGDVAGLVALTLVSFDPNILGHSALVTTDMGVSLFFLASVYAFYRYAKQPSLGRLAVAGVVSGLLLATKHSGVLLAPMLVLLIAWEVLLSPRETRARVAARLTGALGAMVVIGVAVLWAFYGFRYAARPGGLPFPTVAEYAQPLSHFTQAAMNFFARLHLLPQSWLVGLVDVKRMAEFYPTFALGRNYAHGVWFYFPLVILIKSTLGLLGVAAITFFALATRRLAKAREVGYLLIPALFYLAVAAIAGMDIGARHILPVYTFLFVLVGGGVSALVAVGRGWRWACGVLVAAHIVSALMAFPNYIPYANEAWGGPKNVHNLLSDANVDWAQQLIQVKQWQDRHPGEECWFAYFAYPEIQPETYGIQCHHLPTVDILWMGGAEVTPAMVHGNVLVSAGDLSGCEWATSRENPYADLRSRRPDEAIDEGVFVYRGDVALKGAALLSRVLRASELSGAGKKDEGLALLREAVAIDPGDVRSEAALGDAAAAAGLKDEARKAYGAALSAAQKLTVNEQAGVVQELEKKLQKL